jgi:threonylcarbamoyladenosine tRNA methylthiotransferase MtaB
MRYFTEQHLGEERPVLFEHTTRKNNNMEGYTDNYIRIETPYDESLVNKIVNWKIQ